MGSYVKNDSDFLKPLELILRLSHDNGRVEGGFSINESIILNGMKERTEGSCLCCEAEDLKRTFGIAEETPNNRATSETGQRNAGFGN